MHGTLVQCSNVALNKFNSVPVFTGCPEIIEFEPFLKEIQTGPKKGPRAQEYQPYARVVQGTECSGDCVVVVCPFQSQTS